MIDAEATFNGNHRGLLARLRAGLDEAEDLEDRGQEGASVMVARLTSLADDFVRYVEANEGWLYPSIAPLVRSQKQVMAPMMLDARAVADYAAVGEQTALETLTATEEGRETRRRAIERLAAQFEAVMRLHFEKLERIYLPLLADLSTEQRQTIVDGMAADYETPPLWPEIADRR
jgi:hypothetical protein